MRLIIAIIVGLYAGACAPDYATRHGINVYCDDTNMCLEQGGVEAVTESTIDAVYNSDKFRREIARTAPSLVVLSVQDYPCPDIPDDTCYGHYDTRSNTLYTVYRPCIATTALAHELLHAYHLLVDNYVDYEHDDMNLFSMRCNTLVCRNTAADWIIYYKTVMLCDE